MRSILLLDILCTGSGFATFSSLDVRNVFRSYTLSLSRPPSSGSGELIKHKALRLQSSHVQMQQRWRGCVPDGPRHVFPQPIDRCERVREDRDGADGSWQWRREDLTVNGWLRQWYIDRGGDQGVCTGNGANVKRKGQRRHRRTV